LARSGSIFTTYIDRVILRNRRLAAAFYGNYDLICESTAF
jgi:hypothetical protein